MNTDNHGRTLEEGFSRLEDALNTGFCESHKQLRLCHEDLSFIKYGLGVILLSDVLLLWLIK